MWPAGETTKTANSRERDFTWSTASSLSFWLTLFPMWSKQSQNLECLVSWAISAGDAGLGRVSQKWEEQMLLKEPRGCARPAGAMRWSHMSTSPPKSCSLSHSLISQQRSNDVRKSSLEECSFGQNIQREMGISAFCAQENQEHGLMTPFRSYLQEESCDVNTGPGWLRGNSIAISISLHQKVENVHGKKMPSMHAMGQSGRQERMGSICWALSPGLHSIQHQSPCLFSGVEKWDLFLVKMFKILWMCFLAGQCLCLKIPGAYQYCLLLILVAVPQAWKSRAVKPREQHHNNSV